MEETGKDMVELIKKGGTFYGQTGCFDHRFFEGDWEGSGG
jgi:hypothetical protein